MASYANRAASAYKKLGVETDAMSASPHQLIVLLFDGARSALGRAQWAISQNDAAGKGQALSKAIDIIELVSPPGDPDRQLRRVAHCLPRRVGLLCLEQPQQ